MPKLQLFALAAVGLSALAAPLPGRAAPVAEAVAMGVWLIPGGIAPNRQPDGNTVIFQAPEGLVVIDTGRHPAQRQAILDFAAAQGRPIVAIVNTHWHLDHVSGNPALKRAYPKAKVYASAAIDGALKTFLPKSAADGRTYRHRRGGRGPAAGRGDRGLRGPEAGGPDPAAEPGSQRGDSGRRLAL